jgi:tight adherence protein B
MSVVTIFVILLVAVFATVAYFMEPSEADKRTRKRLAALNRQTAEEFEEGIERDQVTFSRIALVDRYLRNNRIALKLQLMLDQAKSPWTVSRLSFYSAVLMIVGGMIGRWWIPMGFTGWIPGMILGIGPLLWVLYKRSVRLRKLAEMLPEAVDLMSRTLRAGYALPSSLVMVADELSDPLGPEFRRTADELNYGLPFREALLNLANRTPVTDLQFLITAILVQKETGGNLVELLDKITAVLRSRVHLQQKVRVFTAQGRITGAILVAMPFVLFVALNLVKPGYTQPLFESETGLKMVYAALALMAIGVMAIRRVIKIEV